MSYWPLLHPWDHRPHLQPRYRLTRAPAPAPIVRSIWDDARSHWDDQQSQWDQERIPGPPLPITRHDVVQQLRLAPGSEADNGPEAPLLDRMIRAAVSHLERYCSNALTPQDWIMRMFVLPHVLHIPIAPLLRVVEIKVGEDVLDPDSYYVELDDRLPGTVLTRLWPNYSAGAVTIRFIAGYETPDLVPEAIKQALLMAIAAWFENREELQQFTLTPMVELGWSDLLSPYREIGFA